MKKGSLILVFLFFAFAVYGELNVLYPNVNGEGEKLFGYAVLKLALENSDVDYKLSVTKQKINNSRIRALIDKEMVSIADFGTSPEFENDMLPIYFPIDLGLNGWRIFLINKDNESKFANVKSIEDLRKYRAGQGIGWADVAILENAGLKVITAPYLENLFKMTSGKRFDFFPLGANEAHFLLDLNKSVSRNVVVDDNVVLIYPFGRLFFVHKGNVELHDAVEKGLKKSFGNGTFWELFKSHESNKALFEKADLKNRKQILIDNPNMTDEFKKIPEEYFFNLDMLDK